MQIVRIRLRKPRRVFSFLSPDIPLRRDEPCIVQSDRGLEWGVCVLPPEPCPPEMAGRFTMHVLRKIEADDQSTHRYLIEEEAKAKRIAFNKIRERNLPMKLVDVEYTFDKRKVIFYFTAEDRVDFRELVRDLAQDLRARIELRHIQVRDEAKMVGGIGGCGRELCCTSWLNDFKPISMRMAKKQNLSLNPSKISGQCGRLLCCLSYENDQYESFKRRAKPAQEPAAALDEAPAAARERAPQQPRDGQRPPREERRPKRPRPDHSSAGARHEPVSPDAAG
jgi:cell fate regulator YaaT (PSP1 superfamily)